MIGLKCPETRTIGDIEHNQGNIEPISRKAQIFGQAIDFRIADIASVDESEQPAIVIRTVREKPMGRSYHIPNSQGMICRSNFRVTRLSRAGSVS